MNRPFSGAAALLFTTLVALPVRAETPLVVGAVRDERGAAIAGATVTASRANGPPLQAATDSAGTFALRGAGVLSVRVTCRYCRPTAAMVRPGEPLAIIVRRYEALADPSPGEADLENLPYARVESAIGLRPFTLLSQSYEPYPGSELSDRGLSPAGSLLVADGNPVYDIVTGSSPYDLIPAQTERSVSVQGASQAFLYGNLAAGGTVDAGAFGDGTNWQVASGGSDVIGRAQLGTNLLNGFATSFSNDEASRQSAGITGTWMPSAGESLGLTAGSEQGRTFGEPEESSSASYSFAGANYTNAQLANLYVAAQLDRGGTLPGSDVSYDQDVWSDQSFAAGAHTNGPFSGFADLAYRQSSGYYIVPPSSGYYGPAPTWTQPPPYQAPPVGATLQQTRADAGFTAAGNAYAVTAGMGAFWIGYAGGGAANAPLRTAMVLPSLQAQILPNARWSGTFEAAGSFTLPTFLQQYGAGYAPGALLFTRSGLTAATLDYSDLSRLRVAFEAACENVAGASPGKISSAGISTAWQIAPELSLRAWLMHVTDTAAAYGVQPYGGSAPTLDAFWLTYANGGAIRFDAIYRRDLLDGAPFYHVDGDLSGPISGGLRWYTGVEDRLRRTFVDVGLRFGGQ